MHDRDVPSEQVGKLTKIERRSQTRCKQVIERGAQASTRIERLENSPVQRQIALAIVDFFLVVQATRGEEYPTDDQRT